MKLQSIHLKNFRCFDSFDLGLHEQVTLLVGLNASGKTTVLDALAVSLGAWMRGTREASAEDRPIRRADARLIRQEGDGLATLTPIYPVSIRAEGTLNGIPLSWVRERLRSTGRTTTGGAKSIRKSAEATEKAASTDPQSELPLFVYYGTGRLWVQKRDVQPNHLGSRMQGYASCLALASNTRLFQRWMAWRESDRIQRIAAALEHGADLGMVKTPHLDAVASAAQSCLDGATRFFYSANHQELRVEFDDGRMLSFDRLSDGQRSIVSLVADLSWRAAQLNPQHGEDAPAKIKGVALIDEIELHLHPAWQRRIIGDLTRVFPNVQFVFTTHSPQVISTARPEWLRLLGPDGVHAAGHVYGRDTNAVLRDIMGVSERPIWMEEKFARLEQLIEAGDVAAASALLEEVRDDVGDTDRSLMALEWELQDRESVRAHDQ